MYSRERFIELDSLRGIAAIGVVLWHYTAMWQARPMNWLFAPFYDCGLLLVDFFFVLSGFVIARSYWTTDRSGHFLTNIGRRIARIYPLHLFALLSILPLQVALTRLLGPLDIYFLHNDAYHFVLNLFLLNRSSLEVGFSYNSPSWSISTEMIANAFFFAIISLGKRAALASLLTALIVTALLITKFGLITSNFIFGIVNTDVVRTLFGFIVGVLTYKISMMQWLQTHRDSIVADLILAGSVCALAAYMTLDRGRLIPPEHFAPLVFPTILLSAIHSKYLRRALRLAPLAKLGEWSYSIYLIHFPLLLTTLLISTLLGYKAPYASAWFVIAFLGVVILIASLTYKLIERPGNRLLLRSLSMGRTTFPHDALR